MEFRILGPLEIIIRGDRLRVADSREQKILAMLLLQPGHVVPLGRLVAAAWDDQPPPSATKLIRNGVSVLRRRLSDGTASRQLIATHPAGYALQVPPQHIDLAVFEDRVARGRQLASADQLEPAVAYLREALALWRGDPLAGVSGQLIQGAATRLAEQRLTVQEECLSHELALGRGPLLVDELAALAAVHPLRERLQAQLMLAMYRTGRRGDALEVYRRARQLLVQELGIEPGTELTELHRAILSGDCGPDVPTTARQGGSETQRTAVLREDDSTVVASPRPEAATGLRGAPRELPPAPAAFTGRLPAMRELDALLTPHQAATTPTIVAIAGTAGVGKTALAIQWARGIADRFPDGHLFANLRGFDPNDRPMSASDAIWGFLYAMHVPPDRIPASLADRSRMLRTVLAGKRVLMVLDNARDPEHVRPMLPGAPTCLAVVTSRHSLAGLIALNGARSLVLDVMPADEAAQLITARLDAARVAAESAAVADIVDACAGLPLALVVASGRAVSGTLPLADLAAELRATRHRLDAFASADAASDVRAVLSWSYGALADDAARLFRLLGLNPGPNITLPAAASLAGVETKEANRWLRSLIDANLVLRRGAGEFTTHDLLHAYANELAAKIDPPVDRHAALARMLDHYLHSANRAADLLYPHRYGQSLPPPDAGVTIAALDNHEEALAWFTLQQEPLAGAIRIAQAHGFDRHIWHLAGACRVFLDRTGQWRKMADAHRAGLAAAQRSDDRVGFAHMTHGLALAHRYLGDLERARECYEQSIAGFERIGDLLGAAHGHLNLALVLEDRGHIGAALTQCEFSLSTFRAAGHASGEAKALNSVGWYQAQQGNHAAALANCQRAAVMVSELGDGFGEALTWDSIGYIHHQLGEYDEALAAYSRSLELWRDLADQSSIADVTIRLGDTLEAAGRTSEARNAWKRALAVIAETGHRDTEDVRCRLGRG